MCLLRLIILLRCRILILLRACSLHWAGVSAGCGRVLPTIARAEMDAVCSVCVYPFIGVYVHMHDKTHIKQINGEGFSNLAWAFAKVGPSADKL